VRLSWPSIGRIALALFIAICVLGASGCDVEDEIWTANAPSPDGRWLATARTLETSGTGLIHTDVFLKWTKGSNSPEHILGFVHDGPRTINLSMNWVAPTHLDVTYDRLATVDLQVVKLGDVDISPRDLWLRDLSKVPDRTLQQLPDDLGIRIAPNPGKSGSR
jgi:hypothetical protein